MAYWIGSWVAVYVGWKKWENNFDSARLDEHVLAKGDFGLWRLEIAVLAQRVIVHLMTGIALGVVFGGLTLIYIGLETINIILLVTAGLLSGIVAGCFRKWPTAHDINKEYFKYDARR